MPDSPEDELHTGKGKGGEIGFRIASPPFFIACNALLAGLIKTISPS